MNQTQPSFYLILLWKDLAKTRYVVLLSFVFAALGAEAQFKKGDKYLGGTLGIEVSSADNYSYGEPDTKTRSFSILPTAGFFLNDKWVIGGWLGYSTSSYKHYNGFEVQKYKSHSFSVHALSRRYFSLSDKFYFVLEGSLGYSRAESTNSNLLSVKEKSYNTGINVRPLFIFFPTANWGIEAGIGGLGYSHSKNLTSERSSNNFSAHYSGFNLGFTYYFR